MSSLHKLKISLRLLKSKLNEAGTYLRKEFPDRIAEGATISM